MVTNLSDNFRLIHYDYNRIIIRISFYVKLLKKNRVFLITKFDRAAKFRRNSGIMRSKCD